MLRLLKLACAVVLIAGVSIPVVAQTGTAGRSPAQTPSRTTTGTSKTVPQTQAAQSARPGSTSGTPKAGGVTQTGGLAGNPRLEKSLDVQPEPAVDPALEQVLQEWYDESRDIKRLHGEHNRYVYEYLFGVEKRASGQFYYEAPDRGRIDLGPDRSEQGKNSPKKNPDNNQSVQLTIKPDAPERWICDGQQVLIIDDEQKVAQQIPIPQQGQGKNMMDGPLPFLFGMPPEKAKQRYFMKLLKADDKEIDLLVVPRWQQDAANYKWARVRIERATMLPMAVQMMDPAGSRETVYTFGKITKNAEPGLLSKLAFWKEKDPFKPDLKSYKVQVAEIEEGNPKLNVPGVPVAVPSVIGMDHNTAKELLQRSGFQVKVFRGDPATQQDLVHRVQKQNPAPRQKLAAGGDVTISLYMPPVQGAAATQVPQALPNKQGQVRVPDLRGLSWQEAKAECQKSGLTLKYQWGQNAGKKDELYRAYEQAPAPGSLMQSSEAIVLKLYRNPDAPVKAADGK